MTDINVDDEGEGMTELDWDAGADFAGIADRIEHMGALERDGWWGETSYDPEQEEVMRTVAHVVGRVARNMDECDESGPSPVAELLVRVGDLLDWYLAIGSDENEPLSAEVEQVRLAVNALSLKVAEHRDEKRREWQEQMAARH